MADHNLLADAMTPIKGMRFLHSRWIDPTKMPERIPALFEVTGFKHGLVYYAPVYTYDGGRQELSKKRECIKAEEFNTVCKEKIEL